MNWKTWTPLVLALVLGLLAAKVGRDLVVRGRSSGATATALATIVVAQADMTPGQVLGEGDLAVAKVAAGHVPRNAFRAASELVGRVVIVPVVKDQPVLETLLAPVGSGSGAQALVPEGMRAVNVDVNEERGMAGMLTPGCHVDVISTLQDDTAKCAVARAIVQNVRVVAVGQSVVSSAKKDEPVVARTVTLIATPQQAEAIELASNTGRVRLVLRSPRDQTASSGSGTTIASLLGQSRIMNPAPMRPETAIAKVEPKRPADLPVAKVPAAPKRWAIEVISGAAEASKVEFDLPKPTPAVQITGNADAVDQALPVPGVQ